MSDHVSVRNLCLHGYHGVLPEETKLGQKFYLDIDCELDLAPCAETDDYREAVCYGDLCKLAAEISDRGPYKLIETLGDRVARTILERFDRVGTAIVRVRKPSAPLAAALDHVEVTITRRRSYRVGFSLGSNMGDKVANLRTALAWLNAEDDLEIDRVSRFYRTAPWGKEDQDWFVNACATGCTTRTPIELLKTLKRIELQLGRVPGERWGPRVIDIDLLFADDLQMETTLLSLPHPGMFDRSFVLMPLAEIAADRHVLGRRIGDAAAEVERTTDDILLLEG